MPSYAAILSRWAAKINTRTLKHLRLADILAGHTCPPLGLEDFEAYLAFHEHTLECLQFVVWFHDYRARFYALPPEDQALSPGPTSYSFHAPCRASIERRIDRAIELETGADFKMSTLGSGIVSVLPSTYPPSTGHARYNAPASPLSSSSAYSPTSPTPLLHHHSLTPGLIHSPPTAASSSSPVDSPQYPNHKGLDPSQQPFREEVSRVLATFLKPGAKKELSLDASTREAIIRNMVWNTHPDVFLPAYEAVYESLDTQSVPRFLEFSTPNINLPKQLYWYALGIGNMSLAFIASLLFIILLPIPPWYFRILRILPIPLSALGFMQAYSAWRGYCSQIWRRDSRQLHVWEMQHLDDSDSAQDGVTAHGWQKLVLASSSSLPLPVPAGSSTSTVQVNSIAPFAGTRESTLAYGRSRHSGGVEEESGPRKRAKTSPVRNGFRRPPIFGPEKIVEDPLIKNLHRQMMSDIYHVGFWWSVFYTALTMSVPSYKKR